MSGGNYFRGTFCDEGENFQGQFSSGAIVRGQLSAGYFSSGEIVLEPPHTHNNIHEEYNSIFHLFSSCSGTCLRIRKIKEEYVIYLIKSARSPRTTSLRAFFLSNNR